MADFDEQSQVVVPPAFVALYLAPGRFKPSLPRAELAARHELCEDLANALMEQASATFHRLNLAPEDVLLRISNGLEQPESGLQNGEAGWVTGRLAELLGWPWPDAPLKSG